MWSFYGGNENVEMGVWSHRAGQNKERNNPYIIRAAKETGRNIQENVRK